MKLSIVATLYKSESCVEEFYNRATVSAKQLVNHDYEIILVNDGSPDNSLDLAIKLSQSDFHVVVVDLSRNFGHHKAMMTGLAHAQGDYVFLIDSDLEEEPEWLLNFSEQMRQENCDVVYGVQEKRKGKWFEYWSGHFFYNFLKLLTNYSFPENVTTARLMTRRYVNALLLHDEREVFLMGLWYITGFFQTSQTVKKHHISETTYTFRHKMAILVNSITSFSSVPLVSIFYIGSFIFLITVCFIIYFLINWFFLAKPLSGWTSVIVSIWLLGGLIISFVGVIGIYLSKIFSETKRRPYTIVRHVYGKKEN